MWQSLPEFGTGVVYAILIAAAYTFAVALAAGRGHPRLLKSARLGAYATAAIVFFAVILLLYAFISHDFRIRYVARYSDRTMSDWYLTAALWGGQDGSLLWWCFLLAAYTAGCVAWLKGRYRQLQPYIIATLMVVISFFAVLMLFAANPFEASIAGARPDGEGLNPLLQNYWMIIHPPALYLGFVGCTIPSRSASPRSSPAASTTSGSSPSVNGCCSRSCSSRSATGSAWPGPTRSSAGAASGPGIRSKTRPACLGSPLAPTSTRP